MIAALTIETGVKLRLRDGSIVEVAQNPQNGIWLFCNYLNSPDPEKANLADTPIYVEEVSGLAEA